MKSIIFVPGLFCAMFGGMTATAEEPPAPVMRKLLKGIQKTVLEKVERKIAKEPVYKKSPRYCLAVFGKDAKFAVWLVVDGDTVYVDLNGNGDLTDRGEKFQLERTDCGVYGPPCRSETFSTAIPS